MSMITLKNFKAENQIGNCIRSEVATLLLDNHSKHVSKL